MKMWLLALRPWSLTATLAPISMAIVLAWREGVTNWLLSTLMLISGCALQLAVNLRNTYVDGLNGVDADREERRCCLPYLKQILGVAIFVMGIGVLTGLAVAMLSDWRLILLAVPGFIGAWCYTGHWFKYSGLGVPGVFILMGVLEPLAAYYALALRLTGEIILLSLPIALLVTAILHANDMRDIRRDREAGIRTFTILIGSLWAKRFYLLLVIAPFLLLCILPQLCPLPLVAVPLAVRAGLIAWNVEEPAELLGETGRLHLIYSLLYIVGLIIR